MAIDCRSNKYSIWILISIIRLGEENNIIVDIAELNLKDQKVLVNQNTILDILKNLQISNSIIDENTWYHKSRFKRFLIRIWGLHNFNV